MTQRREVTAAEEAKKVAALAPAPLVSAVRDEPSRRLTPIGVHACVARCTPACVHVCVQPFEADTRLDAVSAGEVQELLVGDGGATLLESAASTGE